MEYKSSEIKAGIFILLSVALFIGFLAVIVGMNSWTEKETFRARFTYVGGIEKGSIVRYAGLEVGRVVGLKLPGGDDPRVELQLEVKKDTPIRQDSKAFITTIGIMGAYYLEVTAGSPDAPRIPSGGLIPSNDVPGFAQMSGPAASATEQLSELLARLNDVLNDDNRKNISDMIAAFNHMAEVTADSMGLVFTHLDKLSKELEQMTVTISTMLVQKDSSITGSLTALENTLKQSEELMSKLNSAFDEMDYTVVQNRDAYNEIVKNMSAISRNLQDFTQSIKEQPWSLVRKSAPPERKLP
ncbi:MAG: MCE family protein [Actinobacteria bacterium]|nr:MCE family protein [Actinomycetota bacterium]